MIEFEELNQRLMQSEEPISNLKEALDIDNVKIQIEELEKQSAAPAMDDTKDRMHPCHHPNRLALVNVMKNAGSGAMTDWKIISSADTSIAHLPYLEINALICAKSPLLNIATTLFRKECTDGTYK